jgi:hypothetical protein
MREMLRSQVRWFLCRKDCWYLWRPMPGLRAGLAGSTAHGSLGLHCTQQKQRPATMENSVPSSVCSIKKAADISYPDDGGFPGRPLQHLHDAEDYSRSQDAAAQE